jgi:hypothetical protein
MPFLLEERFVFLLGPINLFPNGSRQFGQQVTAFLLHLFGLLLKQSDLTIAPGGQLLLNSRKSSFG